MPLPPWALINSTRALSGPDFVLSILTGMHLQHVCNLCKQINVPWPSLLLT